ncbi:MAG: hypothetical protein GXX96_28545 [Planctomycetaceae bacterium]|nr:hypothetical protein [Planctomycetaceae bacterium]
MRRPQEASEKKLNRREILGAAAVSWAGASAVLAADPTASAQQPEAGSGARPFATLIDSASPELWFDPAADVTDWQQRLRRRLVEILALPPGPHGPLGAEVQREAETGDYTIDRIAFTSEPNERVPGYVLRPRRGRPPFPVMICLQGHSPGMHISIGRASNERERQSIAGGRDLAIQAVANGWAALVIEQRAFGLRAYQGRSCQDASLAMLLLGRPITGGRVLDVMRAIDLIAAWPDLDATRIGCVGNSMGGTVSFYAACVDPRIRLAVVSCAFGPFADTWMWTPHCACGYLPGVYAAADMPDLAGLIAPRHLLVVAGKKDNLARFEGVVSGVERARQIFAAAGSPDHVRLLADEGGHQFYPDLAWPEINKVAASW